MAKLRRFADAPECREPLSIAVAGQGLGIPAGARFSIEHERNDGRDEPEFQIKWRSEDKAPAEKVGSGFSVSRRDRQRLRRRPL